MCQACHHEKELQREVGRRKRPTRYTDPAVATPLMKKFHKRATQTAKAVPQKREAPSAADHVAPSKARKQTTTAQDVTTAVPVTPVSTVANVQLSALILHLRAESNGHLLVRRLHDELDTAEDSEVPVTEDLSSEINAGMSVGDMINADDDIQQIVHVTCKQPQNTDITAHNNQQKTESAAPTDLMLLLLKMKHRLTKEATVDIAKLINVMMNAESQMP